MAGGGEAAGGDRGIPPRSPRPRAARPRLLRRRRPALRRRGRGAGARGLLRLPLAGLDGPLELVDRPLDLGEAARLNVPPPQLGVHLGVGLRRARRLSRLRLRGGLRFCRPRGRRGLAPGLLLQDRQRGLLPLAQLLYYTLSCYIIG